MKKPLAIVITGPTASGKSALAVNLAQTLKTDIISADSRQIYKGIPIVTAVPTEEEKGGIRHHLMQCLELDQYYSASLFEQQALSIMGDIFKNNDTIIICGGSMLYLDALTQGIDILPTVPSDLRETLMNLWQEKGDNWLLKQLKELDPTYYAHADHNNLKRIFHAVEISITASSPYSSLLGKQKPEREFELLKICLTGSRDYLFEKINGRVVTMMERGLENEARCVYHLRHLNSLNTVGLKEMFAYFDGCLTKGEAIAKIQKNTRVYAKKQETWHKRDEKMVRLDFASPIESNKNKILQIISGYRS